MADIELKDGEKLVFDVYRKNGAELEYLGYLLGKGFDPSESGGSGSYKEEATNVGKWIDGSPIYRRVLSLDPTKSGLEPTEINNMNFYATNYTLENAKVIVNALMTGTLEDNTLFNIPVMLYLRNGIVCFAVDSELKTLDNTNNLIVEYVGIK